MRRNKPLRRPSSFRPEQRRFLIYCEGECTEEQYFSGLRQELRSLPVTISLGPSHGEPKSLVREAIKHKERAHRSAADRYTACDEVWCVMDVEAPRPHASLEEALRMAREGGIEVALTNPCFELWLLLHFRSVARYHTSEAMQRALEREAACGYATERKHMEYAALGGLQGKGYADARTRAEKLRARCPAGHRAGNPWTDVDRLVELFRAACGRDR